MEGGSTPSPKRRNGLCVALNGLQVRHGLLEPEMATASGKLASSTLSSVVRTEPQDADACLQPPGPTVSFQLSCHRAVHDRGWLKVGEPHPIRP